MHLSLQHASRTAKQRVIPDLLSELYARGKMIQSLDDCGGVSPVGGTLYVTCLKLKITKAKSTQKASIHPVAGHCVMTKPFFPQKSIPVAPSDNLWMESGKKNNNCR